MMKLVSIIIPLHNAELYLKECLDSALNQTYSNTEILIIENCSTDESLRVAKDYEARYNKIHVYIGTKPNAAAARNIGLKYAKGDYIQFLDADDTLPDDKIEKQMCIMESCGYSDDVIAFCRWKRMDESCPPDFIKCLFHDYGVASDMLIDYSLNKCYLMPHCFLISKALIDLAGHWDEDLTLNDDGEFMARQLASAKILKFADVTVDYRRPNNSLSRQNSALHMVSGLKALNSIIVQISKSDNPLYKEAIFQKVNRDILSVYPFFHKERKSVLDCMWRLIGKRNLVYPCLGWKAWVHYYLVKFHIVSYIWKA